MHDFFAINYHFKYDLNIFKYIYFPQIFYKKRASNCEPLFFFGLVMQRSSFIHSKFSYDDDEYEVLKCVKFWH